jgi:hypothetical protein
MRSIVADKYYGDHSCIGNDAKKKIFQVFALEQGHYIVSEISPTFPQLPIAKIPQVLDQCETIEEFRAWIQTSTQQKP